MKSIIFNVLKRWVPLAFLATVLSGLVYATVQQSLRQGANDPQVQMAEDIASQLGTVTSTQNIYIDSPDAVSINGSLAPYFVIYDDSGRAATGTGMLDGALPNLPSGVFDYARNFGEERLTWQPRRDIRHAVVLVKARSGFVMAGRSLREVEIREWRTEFATLAAWAFALGGLLVLEIIFALIESRLSRLMKK